MMTEDNKKHGMTGKQNALKDEKLESVITFRCKKEDKARWIQAAIIEKMKLTPWIIKTLDEASKTLK